MPKRPQGAALWVWVKKVAIQYHITAKGATQRKNAAAYIAISSLCSPPPPLARPPVEGQFLRAHTHTYTLLALDTHTDTTVPLVSSVLSLSPSLPLSHTLSLYHWPGL